MSPAGVSTAAYAPGSLVKARGREWVVQPGSDAELLVLRPLGGAQDDLAGVLPAIEKVEAASFPPPTADDLGDQSAASLLRAALRIGFRSGAGPFRSLAQLAVDPRSYQLVPLLMALRQETVRLLIADDVGIGKTVESGLIAAELLAQGEAKGLAVLCSPALAEQWQQELKNKFGINAELVLASTVPRLERTLDMGQSLFDKYPNAIVSTDYIKSTKHRDNFVDHCPDLVIVDEAHTCVADNSGAAKGGRQLRYELVRRLAEDPKRHLLLVTATPHSGKEDPFRDLLGLLDPSLAEVALDTDAGRRKLAEHFVQRRRADIRQYLTNTAFAEETPFPSDRLNTDIAYKLSPDYRKLLDTVLSYAREQALDTSDGVVRQRVRWWSALALLRSLASSPRAAAQTLRTRAANADARTEAEANEQGQAAVLDLIEDDTVLAVDAAPGADIGSYEGSARARLLRMAKQAEALEGKADTKLAKLVTVVKDLLKEGYNPIVFCRYIPTAEYVGEQLKAALKTVAVEPVTGTLSPDQRIARIERLVKGTAAEDGEEDVAPPAKRVLVATDCLSEGVNLQDGFDAVVHYDLAWNPTRHEQREGRVDRYGQRAAKVKAVTLYGSDNQIDGIVLDVLLRKYNEIRKATGVAVTMPDASDNVMKAILEGLLLHDKDHDQLALDLDLTTERDELHAKWVSAAERERASRARYAQHAIKDQDVAAQIAKVRAALGDGREVAEFTRTALGKLRATLEPTGDGFIATTAGLPPALRDSLAAVLGPKNAEQAAFTARPPAARGQAALVRTDPAVGAVARFVLDAALDQRMDDWTRPARRSGVIRTRGVTTRTTLLLVRYRFHLDLPTRDGGVRQQIAEDARLLAFRSSPARADWLTDDEATALLDLRADENTLPELAVATVGRVIDGLGALIPHLDEYGKRLETELRDSHHTVRTAAGARRRGLGVKVQQPADVLGLYVYLPVTGEAR